MKFILNPKIIITLLLITLAVMLNPACKSTNKVSKGVKEANKAQAEQRKGVTKEYDDAIKKHNEQQSEYAKQLMKDMKKRAKQNNKKKSRSFWDKLFRRNC